MQILVYFICQYHMGDNAPTSKTRGPIYMPGIAKDPYGEILYGSYKGTMSVIRVNY